MDVFAIASTIWRNKFVTIPIGVIILIALLYVLAVKPATYEASASILFEGPPAAPTQAQIQANPKLATVNPSNPLLSYGSLIDVADISLELLNSPATQEAMAKGGTAPKYKASLSTAYGTPPIIQITGTGSNAEQAIQSTAIVAKQIMQNLTQMQTQQHVNPRYMIKTQKLVTPVHASSSISGKLRSAIAFLAVGIIVMMLSVSISEGLRRRRSDNNSSGQQVPSAVASRLSTGADTAGSVTRPVATLPQLNSSPQLRQRAAELAAAGCTAAEIAESLNAEGLRPPKNAAAFTQSSARDLLGALGLQHARTPASRPELGEHEWWLRDLAAHLGMSKDTLDAWIRRGWADGYLHPEARLIVVRADTAEVERLRALHQVPHSQHNRRAWQRKAAHVSTTRAGSDDNADKPRL